MARKTDDDSTDSPDVTDVLARLTTALESLAARQQDSPNETIMVMMDKLTGALARVSESNIEGSKLLAEEHRRAHRPSNEVVPKVSVFNRRGENLPAGSEGPIKQPLKCLMMIPWLVEWESCTREEVDLLNLLESGEYQLKRTDGSKVRVTVVIEYKADNITPSRLVLTHDTAFNNDNFRLIPAFSDMLRQLLRQHDRAIADAARTVLTDEEEEALIEAGELSVSM